MTFEEIIQQIESGKYAPIYFLHGEEPFFIDQIEEAIDRRVLTDAEKGFNHTILYGKDVDHLQLLDTLRRFPMMSQYQVVILREAQEMRSLAEIVGYIEKPMPTTVFVICHKYKKLDARTKFGKAVATKALVFESKKLYDNQIADWITKSVRSKKRSIDPAAAALLGEYLGTDLAKVQNELDKLFLNLPAGTAITADHIQQFVGISKEFNIFELQKALAGRDLPKIARIQQNFESNIKRNPLIGTIAGLFNFFSKVFQLHELQAQGKSENEILKSLDLRSEWFLRDYRLAARNFSKGQVENVISLLRQFDLRSKGVETDTTSTGDEALQKELFFRILN